MSQGMRQLPSAGRGRRRVLPEGLAADLGPADLDHMQPRVSPLTSKLGANTSVCSMCNIAFSSLGLHEGLVA